MVYKIGSIFVGAIGLFIGYLFVYHYYVLDEVMSFRADYGGLGRNSFVRILEWVIQIGTVGIEVLAVWMWRFKGERSESEQKSKNVWCERFKLWSK